MKKQRQQKLTIEIILADGSIAEIEVVFENGIFMVKDTSISRNSKKVESVIWVLKSEFTSASGIKVKVWEEEKSAA